MRVRGRVSGAEQIRLAYLARPEVIDSPPAREQDDDEELLAVRDQLATVRAAEKLAISVIKKAASSASP